MQFWCRLRRSGRRFLGLFLGLLSASCLHDPGPEPSRRALEFETLVSPSVVPSGTPTSARVSFVVGPSACWRVEWLTVTLREARIHVEGGAIDPRNSDLSCTDAFVRREQRVDLPALAPGDYEVVAGDLRTPLVVSDNIAPGGEKAAFQGTLRFFGPDELQGSGCAWGGYWSSWWFTGVPVDANESHCIIQGDVTQDDPCSLVDQFGPGYFERLVAVSSFQQANDLGAVQHV